MKRKTYSKLILVILLCAFTILAACGKNNGAGAGESQTSGASPSQTTEASSAAPEASKEKVTLKMAMWDSNNEFISFLQEKVKEYSQVAPHVTVELEPFKGDGDYLQAMKVRSAGNELPDILELKPNWLNDFKEQLIPLDGAGFLEKNQYASKYAVDGKIIAVPTVSFPELVYYHPSVFEELGLKVPTTWPQFIEVLTKIKDNGKYIPYAMGGKDAWPDYPFNEFIPHIVSGDESYLSNMAKQDNPFGEGTAFYQGFKQIEELYQAQVFGTDPLGISWDQATVLFSSKKAAVVAAGLWFLPTYEQKTGSTEDIAAFPMPYRASESEPLKLMTFTDHFYGIASSGKHQEEAKAFMEWFYSPEVYQTYIDKAQLNSTFEGVQSNVQFLKDFYAQNQAEAFTYIPGDAEYTRISNAIQLDVKALGQDMMSGKKVDDFVGELNKKWAASKASK
ncbi:ABC transporter substrate-binding protein [Cohnella phaseoli]|uniref:Raffinose/stachyose/melibiose transport system substrate-binding protein n=1 Tax=Cohnella phaseoli TaxID=456490 RepID=A0A3D9IQR0_9BACL|nr:ABC transporter substrate-binding protein [Cohnella phaseoli]RED63426.1 raffinose/stachyose/melibiose transport system substrate-binding protein [Cohnella phaseoli]